VLVAPTPEVKTRFEREHPQYWIGNADVVGTNAMAFIDMVIKQNRRDVGPPVSLLIINRSVFSWRPRGVCGK
jgi:hypothetical protein